MAPKHWQYGSAFQYHRTINLTVSQTESLLYTLWLFTFSDLKTIVIPQTIFGVSSAVCAQVFDLPPVATFEVLTRIPQTLCWTWINLLPFAINNQRRPDAIEEDSINKPWRPMPSRRLTTDRAVILMWLCYLIAFGSSAALGGIRQSACLFALGTWYNDFGGADVDPVTRNFINACGFLSFSSGALEVAYGSALPLSAESTLTRWLFVIGLIILTSVQCQDMADQEGDLIRNRRTLPLTIGDSASRITIVVAVGFWSVFVPHFWDLRLLDAAVPLALGTTVMWRVLTRRTVLEDKGTFRIWNLWMIGVYALPLAKVLRA